MLTRARFTIAAAIELGIPVLSTVQNPERMGGVDPSLESLLTDPIAKMSFSCCGSPEFMRALQLSGRKQIVIVGLETHICVGQTGLDLQAMGYQVVVCPDAVGAGSLDCHKIGMERIRDAGLVPVHSEGVAYEWLKTAKHPCFKRILELTKQARASR